MLISSYFLRQREIIYVTGILEHLKGNQYPYFAVTCDIWKYGKTTKTKKGRDCIGGGSDHTAILKAFPELKDFVALHNADINGAPMYAVENGWYYLDQIGDKFTIDTIKKHLRISTEEAQKVIDTINAKEEFIEYVDSQRERWLSEANAVIVKYNLKGGEITMPNIETLRKFYATHPAFLGFRERSILASIDATAEVWESHKDCIKVSSATSGAFFVLAWNMTGRKQGSVIN